MKYPIPEIPDDSGKKSGTDWVLPKIIGSGRVSGTRQALLAGGTGGGNFSVTGLFITTPSLITDQGQTR